MPKSSQSRLLGTTVTNKTLDQTDFETHWISRFKSHPTYGCYIQTLMDNDWTTNSGRINYSSITRLTKLKVYQIKAMFAELYEIIKDEV